MTAVPPVDAALQTLGQALARLESALDTREALRAQAGADAERRDMELDALRMEYDSLRGEYDQLRAVVQQVDGRLDGTVTRLRALLEG